MIPHTFILLLTLLLFIFPTLPTATEPDDLSLLSRQRRVRPCGRFCRFNLCNFNGTTRFLPNAPFTIFDFPNSASLPFICLADTPIGQLRSRQPVRVRQQGVFVPINRFQPPGLDTPFARNFIRPGKIPFLPFSGIARRRVSGNQWSFLHDRCFILPITNFQVLDPETMLPTRNVNAGPSTRNCVSFRSTAPSLQVQLIWDTPDDFDLALEEPDGTVIDKDNLRSEAGRLLQNNNVDFCDSGLSFGRENIIYFPGSAIQTGEYTVTVTHTTQCDTQEASTWRMVVVYEGAVIATRRGTASVGEGQVVLTRTFEIQ